MKRRIVSTMLSIVLVAVMGCNASATSATSTDNISCSMMYNNINIISAIKDNVQVYQSKTEKEYNSLTPVIENRNGRMIIEIVDGTVLDDEGNGSDQFGFYVKYDSERYSKGAKVRSVFVYNPATNYLDDFAYRMDRLIE